MDTSSCENGVIVRGDPDALRPGTGTFTIAGDIMQKACKNAKGEDFTVYKIATTCGQVFTTYKQDVAQAAKSAMQAGQDVEIDHGATNNYGEVPVKWEIRPIEAAVEVVTEDKIPF